MKYILQKDTPNCRAGDVFILSETGVGYYKNGDRTKAYFSKQDVENNTEWFRIQDSSIFTKDDLDDLQFMIDFMRKSGRAHQHQKYFFSTIERMIEKLKKTIVYASE